ncbi:27063_t:CDS:2, partial [Racocetra persica]
SNSIDSEYKWLAQSNDSTYRGLDDSIIIIELQSIVRVVPIVILYNEDNINILSSIFIREILYKYQGHWKLRSIKYSYKHPSEFALLKIPEMNFPIYKLYINLYYNNFGTYRNIYHSLEGNDLAEIKRHGALRGCRTCNIMRDSWTSDDLDLSMVSRYHHLTNSQFEEISSALILKGCKELATKYGLYLQLPILDRLKRESHHKMSIIL